MYSERNASLFNSEHSVIKELPPDVAREFISLDPEAQKELLRLSAEMAEEKLQSETKSKTISL